MQWRDTPERYGAISRALHWSMAALFAWQFMGMIVKLALGRVPLTRFLVGTHAPVGTLLMALVAVRALWGLANLRRRPGYGRDWRGRAALLGHAVLYLLMLVVPGLALLRQYGSGRGFQPFGIPLMPQTGVEVEWMMAPADLLHSTLAWGLLGLIAGHVLMVAVHRYWWGDDVLGRMLGRPARAPIPDEPSGSGGPGPDPASVTPSRAS